jgi:hypothetical protein
MKKMMLLLLILPFYLFAQSSDQYLVTKSNDTIYYQGDLIVDHDQISHWKTITANDKEFSIREIKCAYFDHNFYYNCDGTRLFKQVVKGKINVFALNPGDTIHNRKGNITKHLFIQKGIGNKPVIYTNRNLVKMIQDQPDLALEIRSKNVKIKGGSAMVISGAIIAGVTVVVGAFGALITEAFGDRESANIFLAFGGSGAFLGAGLIGGGVALKTGTNKLSLDPIYFYNSN